jgi:hypothetical protein
MFVPNMPTPGGRNNKKSISLRPGNRVGKPISGNENTVSMTLPQVNPQADVMKLATQTKMQTKRGTKSRGRKGRDNDTDERERRDPESFRAPVDRTNFFDTDKGTRVNFSLPVKSNYAVQQMENPELIQNNRFNGKLQINLSTFQRSDYLTPVLSDNVTAQYKQIYNRLSREVYQEFRSNIDTIWTFNNFYSAMDAAVRALELFYTVDSVLSYTSNTSRRDENKVLTDYRNRLQSDFDILGYQNSLRRTLKGVTFPEEFSNLIRWTFQSYTSNEDVDQAMNYRFCPTSAFVGDVASLSSSVEAMYTPIMNGITLPEHTRIYAMLAKIRPNWEIVSLPKSCNSAVFDPRHYEMFCNQACVYEDSGGIKFFPNFAEKAINGTLVYCSLQNPEDSDGLAFTLHSPFADNTGVGTNTFFSIDWTNNVSFQRSGNKFIWSEDAGEFVAPYDLNPTTMTQSEDVHKVYSEFDQGLVWASSSPNGRFQRVHFDVVTSQLITIREFTDSLFGLE